MTPDAVFAELLARVGASNGAVVMVNDHELSGWPYVAVAAMKAQKLLKKTLPASSAVCPGCERECAMPVHVLNAKDRTMQAFIVCDKRSDVNRVTVPLDCLEQWQISGDSIAGMLANLLSLRRPGEGGNDAARWEVGTLRGTKHSAHAVLVADGTLKLSLAGHSIPLVEVLTLETDTFRVDRRTLNRLVDKPIGGAGDTESAAQRRERLKERVFALKNKGKRNFLKIVAEEEGLSVTRIKQLLGRKSELIED